MALWDGTREGPAAWAGCRGEPTSAMQAGAIAGWWGEGAWVPATSTFSPSSGKGPQGHIPRKAQLAYERAFSVQAFGQGKESHVTDERNHSWARFAKLLPQLLSSSLIPMSGFSCRGTACVCWCYHRMANRECSVSYPVLYRLCKSCHRPFPHHHYYSSGLVVDVRAKVKHLNSLRGIGSLSEPCH